MSGRHFAILTLSPTQDSKPPSTHARPDPESIPSVAPFVGGTSIAIMKDSSPALHTDDHAGWRKDFTMNYRDRIVLDPAIRFGKPTVRGTRITVGDVLSYLAGGMSEEEILADFSQLERNDIRACLAFAAERERRSASIPAA